MSPQPITSTVHPQFRPALACAAFSLCFLTLVGCGPDKAPTTAPPPAEVVTITLQPRTVPVSFPFVAQIQSSHQVDILARVNGFLEKISYREGEPVTKGQVMFQLDKKPFLSAVAAARAETEIRRSQLFTAKASLDRIRPLAEQNAASKSDLDNAVGAYKSAEAALQQSQANLDKTLQELSYTTINAPFSGVAGAALIREGAYIAASGPSAKLTYLAKLDPVWVDFSVSQNSQASIRQELSSGRLVGPKNDRYTVTVELSDGSRYPLTGIVNFADPTFSQQTGTYLVRAELPNPKGVLRPGMFVRAYLQGTQRPNALTVPQRAVQQSPNGHIVFIVNAQGMAEVRPVETGDWVGQDWIITHGLKAGEQVIVDGFMKLAPGVPVKAVKPEELKQPAAPAKPAAGS
jgi:membrane fusion protein (multidrug efflux system)